MDQAEEIPYRQIRALYNNDTITVYQAYSSTIAIPAVACQQLDASPSFSFDRMTWIKPSFMWMMYRSNFSYKDPGQERILALTLTRTSFNSLLSRAKSNLADHATPGQVDVRVQWDPERSLTLEKLRYRSIQIGIGRTMVKDWVSFGGIIKITDVTGMAREMKNFLDGGQLEAAKALLPQERAYPVPADLETLLGMNS